MIRTFPCAKTNTYRRGTPIDVPFRRFFVQLHGTRPPDLPVRRFFVTRPPDLPVPPAVSAMVRHVPALPVPPPPRPRWRDTSPPYPFPPPRWRDTSPPYPSPPPRPRRRRSPRPLHGAFLMYPHGTGSCGSTRHPLHLPVRTIVARAFPRFCRRGVQNPLTDDPPRPNCSLPRWTPCPWFREFRESVRAGSHSPRRPYCPPASAERAATGRTTCTFDFYLQRLQIMLSCICGR